MLKPTFPTSAFARISGDHLAVASRLLSFVVIGGLCTLAFALAYAPLRSVLSPLPANAAALALTMTANFAANRRFTVAAHAGRLLPQLGGYLIAYAVGIAMSSLTLVISFKLFPGANSGLETLLAIACGGFATLTRFVFPSAWVFRPHHSTVREVNRG